MENNLYIVKTTNIRGESLIKLGYSSNIKSRMLAYKSHNPFTELLATFYREDAIYFEKLFHQSNNSVVLEWYHEDTLNDMIHQIEHGVRLSESKKVTPKSKIFVLEKICYSCKELKLSKEFQKDSRKVDNLTSNCKSCISDTNIKYRSRRNEKNRIYRNKKKGMLLI